MNSQTNSSRDKLSLENVTFSYDKDGDHPALSGFDLSFPAGGISVLTGPSGCGKSTVFYIAAGIYPKYAGVLLSGSARLGGTDIAALTPEVRAHRIGMMFQNPDLQFCMDTVYNELVFCLENISTPREAIGDAAEDALEFCGIGHLKMRSLSTLSGGEKQKAMLACAVAIDPEWLLLDEPFANIDDRSARDIAGKLKRFVREKGKSIVAVDHKLDVWLDIAGSITVMGQGGRIALEMEDPKICDLLGLPQLGVDIPQRPYRLRDGAAQHAGEPPEGRAGGPLILTDVSASVGPGGRKEIIRSLDAEFRAARSHALLGESGVGKSTLLEAICGFRKYRGRITLAGEDIRPAPLRRPRNDIGFVFQNPQDQFVAATVYREIMIGLKARARHGDIADPGAEAERILRNAGLWKYRQLSPYMLSQGEQRRLALSALIAYRPRLLICDEPTYAQDLRSLLSVMDMLDANVREGGLTLLFSTHDRKLSRDYADHIWELTSEGIYEIDQSDL
ncbi:MAG: ATP-binding cassette domain-containing protein [Clostridiales Family XIII bacterium]|nr:ATP-binding cassette domain-containing protein [Clostridiales Family XIII bacterium]